VRPVLREPGELVGRHHPLAERGGVPRGGGHAVAVEQGHAARLAVERAQLAVEGLAQRLRAPAHHDHDRPRPLAADRFEAGGGHGTLVPEHVADAAPTFQRRRPDRPEQRHRERLAGGRGGQDTAIRGDERHQHRPVAGRAALELLEGGLVGGGIVGHEGGQLHGRVTLVAALVGGDLRRELADEADAGLQPVGLGVTNLGVADPQRAGAQPGDHHDAEYRRQGAAPRGPR
jgi:hypothetical protein